MGKIEVYKYSRKSVPQHLSHNPSVYRASSLRCLLLLDAHTAQQCEIIREMLLPLMIQVLAYCSRQKQYHNHRCRDPERTIEIRVPLQHVEEVCPWEGCCRAPLDHLICVHIKELCVEGETP